MVTKIYTLYAQRDYIPAISKQSTLVNPHFPIVGTPEEIAAIYDKEVKQCRGIDSPVFLPFTATYEGTQTEEFNPDDHQEAIFCTANRDPTIHTISFCPSDPRKLNLLFYRQVFQHTFDPLEDTLDNIVFTNPLSTGLEIVGLLKPYPTYNSKLYKVDSSLDAFPSTYLFTARDIPSSDQILHDIVTSFFRNPDWTKMAITRTTGEKHVFSKIG